MIRKALFILLIAGNCLLAQGQYLENKIDFGIGAGFFLPLNSSETSPENDIVYPSLFGNYSFGAGVNSWVDYHLSEDFRLGIQLGGTSFPFWSGDQDVFIISDPILTIISFSVDLHYLPKNLQLAASHFKWGGFVAPGLTYQILQWDEMEQDLESQLPLSSSTINPGFRTGISFFYEFSDFNGLKFDLSYQFMKTDNLYHLDHSFHSLGVSVGVFFKLLKNKHFRYD